MINTNALFSKTERGLIILTNFPAAFYEMANPYTPTPLLDYMRAKKMCNSDLFDSELTMPKRDFLKDLNRYANQNPEINATKDRIFYCQIPTATETASPKNLLWRLGGDSCAPIRSPTDRIPCYWLFQRIY